MFSLVLLAALATNPADSNPMRMQARAARVTSAPFFEQVASTIVIDAAFVDRAHVVRGGFEVSLVLGDGATVALHLEPFSAVSDAVDVRVGARAASDLALTMRSVAHLRGTVVGEPGSVVYLGVGAQGAAGFIDRGPGHARYALRSTTGESRGLVAGPARFDRAGGTSQPEVPLCGTDTTERGGVAGLGAVPPGVTPVIEIAVDTDYEYFHIFDDAAAATEYIATLYGAIAAIFRRDVDSTISIVFLRLMDTPDDLFNDFDPLDEFRDYWNKNMQDVERDLAQLVTGRRDLPYGGVAWLDATCSDFGYSVTGHMIGGFADPYVPAPGNWDLIVVAHELGHNVGSFHTHAYGLDTCNEGTVQRGSIMSYCHINSGATANIDLRFHRVCGDDMEAFIMTSPCVTSDCDGDGIDDVFAIGDGLVVDSNGDGIPDSCQDCDGDAVPDPVAIAAHLVADIDFDGRPDSCEPDCNGNGVPDSFDILSQTSSDAYGDGIPDECEPDCDGNGSADYSDIEADMAIDKGRDALIDACQDCDGDGIDDFVELQGSHSIWVARSDANEVRELHPRSGVVEHIVLVGEAPTYDLAIGPDGFLYASSGRAVWRIDRVARSVVGMAIEYAANIKTRGLAFASDGVLLVARNVDDVRKVDVSTGTDLGALTLGAIPDPRDVYVRGNGLILVSCGDGRVRQYQLNGTGGIFIDGALAPHDFVGVIELPDDGGIVVASRAQQGLLRFDAFSGAALGQFDVQASSLLSQPWGLVASADGRAVIAPSADSSSTVNGYNNFTGYVERTYRVYGADAPSATAIVVAPSSATDKNGNLVPDECEGPLADLNADGHVDGADLAILLGAWDTPGADLDGNGTTDGADLAIVLGSWS